MVFSSLTFLFFFLPACLICYYAFPARTVRNLILTFFSLLFYAWGEPIWVSLLVISSIWDFLNGLFISRFRNHPAIARLGVISSVTVNLALLISFKYADFIVETVNALTGLEFKQPGILLPIGISFYTFQTISYTIDVYRGEVPAQKSLLNFMLFVVSFHQLVAGPIVRYAHIAREIEERVFNLSDFSNGVTRFCKGLFKKVFVANTAGELCLQFLGQGASQTTVLGEWFGLLMYSLQIYFDFSGYSDMAVGLSLLFGVRLPVNFHSPYKAVNIIDFWRRWHMTLSRFLRDYLYVPLGGNRKSRVRRYTNLLLTMLLGGLWHGAGWTFVLWGALHGIYLVINHGWREFRRRLGHNLHHSTPWGRRAGCLLTFVAVVVGWVLFRAPDVDTALSILRAMAGFNGLVLPEAWAAKFAGVAATLSALGIEFGATPALARTGVLNWIWVLLLVVWLAPNTQQIMAAAKPALGVPAEAASRIRWRVAPVTAALTVVLALAVIVNLGRHSEFLYFQF